MSTQTKLVKSHNIFIVKCGINQNNVSVMIDSRHFTIKHIGGD